MIADYTNWIDACNKIVSEKITNWKTMSGVTYMLEHLSYDHSVIYLDNLLKDNVSVDTIKYLTGLNDKNGGTTLHNYIHDIVSSTSSLRYIRHALDICNHIKNKQITQPIRIIEVGGGYGGLCLILQEFAKLQGINISEYYIYDIPNVQSLQQYYLRNFPDIFDKITWKKCDTFGSDIPTNMSNFLISNYCLSEISEQYRTNYLQNILPSISGAYLAWNDNSTNCLPSNRLEVDEEPKTGPYNKIITL